MPKFGFGRQKKLAVALRYEPTRGDSAPTVTAKGSGHFAERIIETARENGIPIREDKALVQVLASLKVDEEIPQELYVAVARILSFLYQVDSNQQIQDAVHFV